MKHIAFALLLTASAFAWNPPIGVCPPEALKKIDHFATLQEGGLLEQGKKYYSTPFDNGKCFLHGYDLWVDKGKFGLVNSKTADRLEYKGKDMVKSGEVYTFNCGMSIIDNENCLSIGKDYIFSIYSSFNEKDTTQFAVIAKPENTLFFKAIYFKNKSRDDMQNSMLQITNSKNMDRLGAFWESNIGGEYRKAEGYIKWSDVLSAIKEVEKSKGGNIQKADALVAALDNIFFSGMRKQPPP